MADLSKGLVAELIYGALTVKSGLPAFYSSESRKAALRPSEFFSATLRPHQNLTRQSFAHQNLPHQPPYLPEPFIDLRHIVSHFNLECTLGAFHFLFIPFLPTREPFLVSALQLLVIHEPVKSPFCDVHL